MPTEIVKGKSPATPRPRVIWDWAGSALKNESTLHQLSPYIGKLKSSIAASLVSQFTNRGNLVYDPFSGSGTVALAFHDELVMLGGNNILQRLLESQSVSSAVADNASQERAVPGTRRAMPPVPHSPPSPRGLAPQPAASFPVSHRAPVPKGNVEYMRVSRDDTGR